MDKIKITFFLPNLDVGGAERVTINLLKQLDKNKFEPVLMLGEKKGFYMETVPAGVPVINLDKSESLGIFLGLFKFFSNSKNNQDIFVSIFPRLSVISILAKIFSSSKIKIIIIEHSVFSKTAKNAATFYRKTVALLIFPFLMRILYHKAECVICVSKGVAADINKITGLDGKIKIVHNPIIDRQIDVMAKENVGHPWFLEKIPIILAVGRLAKAKDYPTLLRAFSLVLKKKDARLIIIGDGPEKIKLYNLSEELGLKDKVDFMGLQKNPYKFMARADIFVLSSKQEGFSTVIIEAMHCGIPVISTNYEADVADIIDNNNSGLIVPVGDASSLAGAIVILLNNPPLRKKFSEAGKIIAEDFTIDKKTKEYEEIFSKIV